MRGKDDVDVVTVDMGTGGMPDLRSVLVGTDGALAAVDVEALAKAVRERLAAGEDLVEAVRRARPAGGAFALAVADDEGVRVLGVRSGPPVTLGWDSGCAAFLIADRPSSIVDLCPEVATVPDDGIVLFVVRGSLGLTRGIVPLSL